MKTAEFLRFTPQFAQELLTDNGFVAQILRAYASVAQTFSLLYRRLFSRQAFEIPRLGDSLYDSGIMFLERAA